MNVTDLLGLLDRVRPSGTGWTALCPAHDDRNPSLSINEGDEGRILLHCHAGCGTEAVCDALGISVRDLFSDEVGPTEAPRQQRTFENASEAEAVVQESVRRQQGPTWDLVARYVYCDADRRELMRVLRYEPPEEPDKTFRPLHRGDEGWVISGLPGLLPLYHLPDIVDSDQVLVVEGEKAADAGAKIGLVTTTSAHGSGAAKRTDWSPLSGKHVVLIPDNDEAGEKYREDVEAALSKLSPVPEIRVLRLPDLPPSGDLADFVAGRDGKGRTAQEICTEIEEVVSTLTPGAPRSSETGTDGKPVIVIEGGELPQIVDRAEEALLAYQEDPIYQRGTMLVRPLRASAATMRELYQRAPGILSLGVVDAPQLVERLTKAAHWFRAKKDDLVPVDAPAKVARTYLSRAGKWKVPTLLGVIEAPTLRPDGSLLTAPGYDPQTCLYFDSGDVKFAPIKKRPTKDDAVQALGKLKAILKDFPWVEPCDLSAALAAILTALVRHSIRTAPLTAYRAPKMASGKSLLADVVAMTLTGRKVSVMSQGKDEEEDKKRLLAILMEGVSVACIDNVERPLGGAALCSVLTQESWRDRVLGRTGTATVPTAATWIATGNNLCFTGDITTRVIVSDLDPGCERPEEREFDVDLHDHVPKIRGELVAAGLTVLRAYIEAGRPDQDLSVFGRFEDWSDWIRSPLVWCGEADPCEGRARIEETDPVRRQLRMILMAWHEELGSKEVTVSEVVRHADPGADGEGGPLWEALCEVAAYRSNKPDSRRLGTYLARYTSRPEAGLRIERMGDRQGVAVWRVVPVGYVGYVGQSGSEKNGFDPEGGKAAENENSPAGNDPHNPHNPPDLFQSTLDEFQGEVVEDDEWPTKTTPFTPSPLITDDDSIERSEVPS